MMIPHGTKNHSEMDTQAGPLTLPIPVFMTFPELVDLHHGVPAAMFPPLHPTSA